MAQGSVDNPVSLDHFQNIVEVHWPPKWWAIEMRVFYSISSSHIDIVECGPPCEINTSPRTADTIGGFEYGYNNPGESLPTFENNGNFFQRTKNQNGDWVWGGFSGQEVSNIQWETPPNNKPYGPWKRSHSDNGYSQAIGGEGWADEGLIRYIRGVGNGTDIEIPNIPFSPGGPSGTKRFSMSTFLSMKASSHKVSGGPKCMNRLTLQSPTCTTMAAMAAQPSDHDFVTWDFSGSTLQFKGKLYRVVGLRTPWPPQIWQDRPSASNRGYWCLMEEVAG